MPLNGGTTMDCYQGGMIMMKKKTNSGRSQQPERQLEARELEQVRGGTVIVSDPGPTGGTGSTK